MDHAVSDIDGPSHHSWNGALFQKLGQLALLPSKERLVFPSFKVPDIAK